LHKKTTKITTLSEYKTVNTQQNMEQEQIIKIKNKQLSYWVKCQWIQISFKTRF